MRGGKILACLRAAPGIFYGWLKAHPFWRGLGCGLLLLLTLAFWAGHYAYFNIPLMPFRPYCHLPYSGHPDDPEYAEIKGEMTEEFIQAILFANSKHWPVARKDNNIFITPNLWLSHWEKLESRNFSDIDKEKVRHLMTGNGITHILEKRENRNWWEIDPAKYGLKDIQDDAECESGFLPRLIIVGGDLAPAEERD